MKRKSKTKDRRKKLAVSGRIIRFPAKVLAPVSLFLKTRLKEIEKRKKDLKEEDPFSNDDRLLDNASPDTDAAEQSGHARTSALRDRLDIKMIQIKKALARIKLGKYGICEECKNMIDTDRLTIYPEATLCVKCERKREKR